MTEEEDDGIPQWSINLKGLKFTWQDAAIAGILIICMLTVKTYAGCSITINNVPLYGNCQQLSDMTSDKLEKMLYQHMQDFTSVNTLDPEYFERLPYVPIEDTTITCPTTTTTNEKICPTCRENKPTECTCPICTKCPSCEFTLSKEQIDWFLNDCRPRDSESSAVQAGEAKACQRVLEYLKVPGRPKFKMTPSVGVGDYYRSSRTEDQGLYCFKNLGGYFIINRTAYLQGEANITRAMWGWNDDQCLKSWLRVNDL